MGFNLFIPTKAYEATVRDRVILYLSEHTDATLTLIHRSIKAAGVRVSFQAVLKAVHKLVDEGILKRVDRVYRVDPHWLENAKRIVDRMYAAGYHVGNAHVSSQKPVSQYVVPNLLALDVLWNDLLSNWASSVGKDKRNVWRGRHCWWLLPRLHEEEHLHDLFRKYKIETYNVVLKPGPMANWAVRYYSGKHEHAKVIPLKQRDTHVSAFGDTVMLFEFPKEITKALDRLFSKQRSLDTLDAAKAMNVFKKRCPVEVSVIHDETLARSYKDEIVGLF